MNIKRFGLLAVLVLTVCGITPVAHASTVASCATTASMWLGSFRGTQHYDGSTQPDHTIALQITQASTGLRVRTVINDWKDEPQYGPTQILSGNIRWVTRTVASPFALYTTYDSTSVTCSGGRVTAFSGVFSVRGEWIGPSSGIEAANTFSVTRTG